MNGRDIEIRIRTRIEEWCEVRYDEVLDNRYKIDFTVTRFKGLYRYFPEIGIQVTTNDDNLAKKDEFLRFHRDGVIVPKCVFMEVDSQADLDGVAFVARIAIGALAFDSKYRDDKVVGLRISKDLSFELFELREDIRQRSESQTGEILQGAVFRFSKQEGFGFIKCPSKGTDFYCHVSQISEAVHRELLTRPGTEVTGGRNVFTDFYNPVPVVFENGGWRPGARVPQALNVQPAAARDGMRAADMSSAPTRSALTFESVKAAIPEAMARLRRQGGSRALPRVLEFVNAQLGGAQALQISNYVGFFGAMA
ncbi:MAG: cold shock domain-containing protein, partial [Chloroflexi bacterium]|nr:cold shock domain-containing protein [Chloroflexota bacterium]